MEKLVIRPPSEWKSLLVRVTRGCKWNRCRFCGIYPALGGPDFSVRTVEDIKSDIDALSTRHGVFRTAFLGDADPIEIGLEEFCEVTRHLRKQFSGLTRVTCYARASTLWKLGTDGLRQLADAGLSRVHVGLESGDADLLKYHRKGQSPRTVTEAARWCREAGIEVSFYVLLGMGGSERWRQHADRTAEVINAADPEFVRVRRIWLYSREEGGLKDCPLVEAIRSGEFAQQTPEGTVLELRRLIEKLDPGISSLVTCDHANNYVRVEGKMPADRERMLAEIDEFLALPEARRQAQYEATGSRI